MSVTEVRPRRGASSVGVSDSGRPGASTTISRCSGASGASRYSPVIQSQRSGPSQVWTIALLSATLWTEVHSVATDVRVDSEGASSVVSGVGSGASTMIRCCSGALKSPCWFPVIRIIALRMVSVGDSVRGVRGPTLQDIRSLLIFAYYSFFLSCYHCISL